MSTRRTLPASILDGSVRSGPPLPPRLAELTGDTLVELLERAVARTPDRIALAIRRGRRRETWTYRDLGRRSRGAAAALAAAGVQPGDRVVTWSPNDPWLVAAYFGAWRLGAAIVPLDVRMANDVAVRIGGRTRPRLVIAGPGLEGQATALGAPVVVLGPDMLAQPPTQADLPAPPGTDDVAEVLFTSGSTSDPKGVVLSHAAMIHNARAIAATAGLAAERALSFIPLSHMYGQTVPLFHGLVTGSQLTFLPELTPTAVFETLRSGHITAITAVPQVLQLLDDAIVGEAKRTGRLGLLRALRRVALRLPVAVRRILFQRVLARLGGALRIVTSGGARLPAELQLAFEAMGVLVVQGYGATEAAAIAGHSRGSRRPGTVGRPMVGMDVRLAQDGELVARGPNLMLGFWEQPDATAAVLVDGWVHTGDAARFEPDGEIVILGRTRDRIALPNGLKVYPEDVEAALRERPEIRSAVVLEHGTGRLVGVLVATDPSADDRSLEAAVAAANATLAPHQRVGRWWRWPEPDLPRTHTLKVRRPDVASWLETVAPLDSGEAGSQVETRSGPGSSPTPASPPSVGSLPAGGPPPTVDREAAVVEAAHRTLVRLRGASPPDLGPSSRMADLDLDSLALVGFALEIADRLGVDLDVEDLTVAEDLAAVARAAASASSTGAPTGVAGASGWAFGRAGRFLRAILEFALVGPVTRYLARPRVEGREHLRGLREPVLICGNHASHLDAPTIRAALPVGIRSRTAVAAAADYFFDRGGLLGPLTALAFGSFPFGRSERVRASLDRVATFLDDGWNVILFPEGTRSKTGEMAPFLDGIGLLTADVGARVLPVHLRGTHAILPKGARRLDRRHRVRVRFGPLVEVPAGTSIAVATAAVEAAVRALAE